MRPFSKSAITMSKRVSRKHIISNQDLLTPRRYRSRSKERFKVSSSGVSSEHTAVLSCLCIVLIPSASAWTSEQADKLNITGFVKNNSDGTVSGEAQGDQSSLDKFKQHLGVGPSQAKVSNVEINDISAKEGEKGFNQ